MARERINAFRRQLLRNHELVHVISSPKFPLRAFEMLQNWQRNRLAQTYADFLARDNDAQACRFFLDELYGGLNVRQRNQEVDRVEPIMTRMLPQKALQAIAEALQLQAISLEFDMEMARILQSRGVKSLETSLYAETYRQCGHQPTRENQILLIRKLGHELERLVKMPLLMQLLTLLSGPARAAGYGLLQEFMENGLRSFRRLSDPTLFVETIYQREWQAMNRLFNRHETPFAFRFNH